MNGRNKLTVLMVIVILSCSSLAAIITIKDRNQIVNDFQNFVDLNLKYALTVIRYNGKKD